ncbi:MAG: hypothetical protein J6M53_08125 [Bacteroidaceae bacterium]|nr:hypothetical protein [Bacteroidaceae bacterium]
MHQLQGSFEFREKGESGLAMEGTAINKEFFEFMARMTQVEWGLSLQSGGAEDYPGYIKTSYLQGELNDAIIPGYDTLIHNHGDTYADVSEERYKVVDFCSYPSRIDLSAIAAAEKMGYSQFYIYNELQKSSALRYNQYVSGSLSMEERAIQLGYTLQ